MEIIILILLIAFLGLVGYWSMDKVDHFCTGLKVQNGQAIPVKTPKCRGMKKFICHRR